MSEQGRGRRYSRHERHSYSGRDYRERSPSRRDDQSASRHRRYGRDDSHSSSRRATALSLPSSVDIPSNARKLPDTAWKPKSGFVQGTVLVNHFRVQSLPIETIYQYELHFVVPEESIRGSKKNTDVSTEMRRKVFQNCEDQLGPMVIGMVFDGVSTAWCTQKLVEDDESMVEKLVNLPGHRAERPNQVSVLARLSGTIDIRSLVSCFTERATDISQQLKWLNALLRDEPARRYMSRPKGLQYYAREDGLYQPLASTGGVLEALRGFHQAISGHFGVLSVNVDTSCTAYYAPNLSLVQVMQAYGGVRDASQLRSADFSFISEKMKGITLFVTHRGEVGRSKRVKVKGLFSKSAREAAFMKTDRDTGEETPTTVLEYFQTKYNLRLKYPDIWLIETAIGFLPAELCMTTTDQRYKEVLEGKETADFIKFATTPAYNRSRQILESVARLAWHKQAKLAAQGLSVEPKMLEVPSSRLPIPAPIYGNGKASVENGSWNLRGKRFCRPSNFRGWGTLYFPMHGRHISPQEIQAFMKSMHDTLRQHGIGVPSQPPLQQVGNIQGDMKAVLQDAINQTRRNFGSSQVIIFCFLHDGTHVGIYQSIKSVMEVDFGVPCQVLKVEKSIRGKGQAQYCANVAMKVNLKIGGQNAYVEDKFLSDQPTLMIGGDVSHPSPAQQRMLDVPPSIFALAGSTDMYASRYTATAIAVPATKEVVDGDDTPPAFAKMFEEHIERFKNKNGGVTPKRVIYWRDGVSEQEEEKLKDSEVRIMRETLEKMGISARLTVILAIKRHHTRLFPSGNSSGSGSGSGSGGGGDKLGNVPPGVVVESGERSAFVLGHSALQGTVRPTHYVKLLDENALGADIFHRLVLHGCYSYGRATRGVHTHAAIYYADQIAERSRARVRVEAGTAVFKDVHPDLRANTMWWQ